MPLPKYGLLVVVDRPLWELFNFKPQTFKLHLSLFLAFESVSRIVDALHIEAGAFMDEGLIKQL